MGLAGSKPKLASKKQSNKSEAFAKLDKAWDSSNENKRTHLTSSEHHNTMATDRIPFFSVVDRNKDGVIDLEEFERCWTGLRLSDTCKLKPDAAFRILDKDNNSHLDIKEFQKFVETMQNVKGSAQIFTLIKNKIFTCKPKRSRVYHNP